MNTTFTAKHIHITGVVQGVGFRPFVYGLATRYDLHGWVCNTSAGVDIEVDGPGEVLVQFVAALSREAPPLARIDAIEVKEIESNGFTSFEIRHSVARPDDFLPISPDIALCDDCRRELLDPADRRYLYPFINCTNCGPRFTIITDIPYDRPFTTMAPFEMCEDCATEYTDPLNRRFHAQPVACPVCGPQAWLQDARGNPTGALRRRQPHRGALREAGDESASQCSGESARGDYALRITPYAIERVRDMLSHGQIIAIKGLGGFHLACDATNDEAVLKLRERKGRIDKPFALMAPGVEAIEQFCEVTPEERALLEAKERPIVLLGKKDSVLISQHVAPGQTTLGVMLPYTPLHELLFQPSAFSPRPLVMTSGNFSEEPIATDNDDALDRLAPLADAFLLHNRDINVRCDDSVVRVFEGKELPIRRSRGYAPYPVKLPALPVRVPPDAHREDAVMSKRPTILAAGAELKNTFCVTRESYAFLSQHIGDMENYETLRSFEDGIAHFERLFRIKPEVIAYDLHPNYMATRYALDRVEQEGLRSIGVQHHHAHIAACMAENGLDGEQPVIGVAFDGTGYGTDGAIWGGEFLIADYRGFRRAAHLAYVPLPGGDAATKHPYRIALSYLRQAGIAWTDDLAPVRAASPIEQAAIRKQIESHLNTFPTSSMGRLFDAVASLCDVRQHINYEGQAAIELEALAQSDEHERYAFEIEAGTEEVERKTYCVQSEAMIRAVVENVRSGAPAAVISARFHNGLAQMVLEVCKVIRREHGLNEVALSGGVWQNITLLRRTLDLLREAKFVVYMHRLVPPNDGGIALGQAVVAAHSQLI